MIKSFRRSKRSIRKILPCVEIRKAYCSQRVVHDQDEEDEVTNLRKKSINNAILYHGVYGMVKLIGRVLGLLRSVGYRRDTEGDDDFFSNLPLKKGDAFTHGRHPP